MKGLKFILILILQVSTLKISAQENAPPPAFTYETYFKADGLNQSSTNSIFQDSQDIVWIANFGGINRFDGYQFESFTHNFGDSTSITDNSVWTFFEDATHNLWVGTKASLSLYKKKTNNFQNFILKKGASTLAIKAINQINVQSLLVGTEGEGLFEFTLWDKSFRKIENIPNCKINDIEIDSEGKVWIATEDKGVFKWNPISNSTERILSNNKSVWDVHIDSNKNIWIGTDENGLWVKKINTNTFKRQVTNVPNQLGGRINTISEDTKGRIWIGSATMGISVFDPELNIFHHFHHNPTDPLSLSENDVSSIHHGSNGVTYVGYYMKGFQKLVESPFHLIKHDPQDEKSLSHNNVYSMYKDRSENLWMGTFGGGLNLLESKNPVTFKRYTHDPANPKSISHDWIRIMYEDSKGRFWVGTWGGGLNLFDREKGTFKRYTSSSFLSDNALSMNIITAIYEDTKGDLWVGTYGQGINIYQPETDDFRQIKNITGDSTSLSDDHITSFLEDENGLWVCTYGGGLNRYDYSTNSFERFIPDTENDSSLNNYKILHLFPDGNNYWLTTLGGGLNYFNPRNKSFTHFIEENGLSNNSTMGMLKTDAGTYWISTNNGLSHFNPSDNTFKNYRIKDGLGSDDYNLEAYMSDEKAYFYFGGKNGITYFNPNDVKVQSTFPKLALRNILIQNNKHDLQSNQEIILPYNKRLTFQFAAVNPARKSNILYAYQLDMDEQWFELNNQNSLEFFALNHGTHTLKVRSTNSDGVWNPEFLTLNFYIPPPWYETWVFRVSAFLFILIVGVLYYRTRIKTLKRNQTILEQKVVSRTKTIAQKNQDLRKSYEKQRELELFKESLVSMIAHDLKNPLVSIINRVSGKKSIDTKQIQRSGGHMLTLIENMLDVLRFEKSKMKLTIGDFSIGQTINTVIKELNPLSDENNIQVSNELEKKFIVRGDEQLIHRVLNNLISNAIKYSPFNSSVEITASEIENNIKISVRDYGAGIPPEDLGKIFEKYEQSEARSFGGAASTGLGLSFCKMAINAHDQKLEVESTKGSGSVFSFTLPVVETGSNITKDKIDQQKLFDFREEDYLLWQELHEKIESLQVYEAGKWSELLDAVIDKNIHTKPICDQLMNLITQYDENGIKLFKDSLMDFLAAKHKQ